MASVSNTAASNYRYKADGTQTSFSERIVTVREKILQQCITRFYSASGKLQTYQDQRRKFVVSGSSKQVSDLEAVSGLVDHDSFKSLVQKSEVQKVLQESGLTNSEIEVLLQETSETQQISNVVLPDDVVDQKQLSILHAVLEKLSKREDALSARNEEEHENFAGAVELSRIEYEDALREGALSRNPNEVLSSVATSALVKRKTHRQPAVHPQHPLNHLAALEHELFAGQENVDDEVRSSDSTYRQQATKRLQVQGNASFDDTHSKSLTELSCYEAGGSELKKVKLDNNSSCEIDAPLCSASHSSRTLWDVKDMSRNAIKSSSIINTNCKVLSDKYSVVNVEDLPVTDISPARREKKKDFSKGFVSLPNPMDLVPLQHIYDHCIALSDLEIEFPNYQSGNPSRTLYVKNLSHQTAPEDLVNIFGHFDVACDRVIYRLLRGRMRGQAFIEFPTMELAEKALKTCLGYMMRGKPLVIEFGKAK